MRRKRATPTVEQRRRILRSRVAAFRIRQAAVDRCRECKKPAHVDGNGIVRKMCRHHLDRDSERKGKGNA